MTQEPLPLEIVEHIIEDLAYEFSGFRAALWEPADMKNCALACRSFLPVCRRYLFYFIYLAIYSDVKSEAMGNLSSLLLKSPEIAEYTRHLGLYFESDFHDVPAEFKMFSKLEGYGLGNSDVFPCRDPEDHQPRVAHFDHKHPSQMSHLRITHGLPFPPIC